MPYGKLQIKLANRGLEISAKALKSFCCGRLVSINGVDVDGDYCIYVYPSYRSSQAVYFESLRQVQRWFDNKMSDKYLPRIRLKDGSAKEQHRRW